MGKFTNGNTPWNKGASLGGRKHGAEKGRRCFLPRPVLLILPDGTIGARFASVSAAARHLKRLTSSITDSCLGRSLCCNRRLIYEEDYVKWVDYSYKPHPNRTSRGQFVKGCHNLYRLSPDGRERKKEAAKKISLARAKNPNDRWGKGGPPHPVLCLTTGEKFPSITLAAKRYGLSDSLICRALRLGIPAGGLKIRGGLTFQRL